MTQTNLLAFGACTHKEGPRKVEGVYKFKLTFNSGVVIWIPVVMESQIDYLINADAVGKRSDG